MREFDDMQSQQRESTVRPSTNSFDSFKQEAQRRRDDDARRLFALLREKYPELKPTEILEMANKFGSM
jgi:hypothetical protein